MHAHGRYAWALYPAVLLTRGATIALLYPLLSFLGKRAGLPLSWRAAVVMWWGGLRGSVGLALALGVYHEEGSLETWGGRDQALLK